MNITPILAALRRNKAGAILIALQVALTLAIVCNALFIIKQRVAHLSRPTGLVESDLFTINTQLVGQPDDLAARQRTDVAAVRALPSVVDAYATNSLPLIQGGSSTGVSLKPEQAHSTARTTTYWVDEHALTALGVRLVAGRNFTSEEVEDKTLFDVGEPPTVMVTQALAKKLFPTGDVLGKPVYIGDSKTPSTIVGIVEQLVVPWVGIWGDDFFENSILQPERLIDSSVRYVVRAKSGRLPEAMKAVEAKLFELDRARIIRNTRTFAEVRARAYRSDHGMAILMAVVCTALLLVTAAGIVGLASFWVGQRHRQIGIRRALGATRTDILRYFQTENLLIAGVGVLVGAVAAVGLNVWLVTHYEMAQLSPLYVLAGAALILALGQLAVLQPALRASRVPPAMATRSV